MDAQQFLAEFGHIVNAPGGTNRLREMIYQLAITGSLTNQLDSDGNAETLLAEITAHRKQLIQKQAYKRQRKLESRPLEIPEAIELPSSWCWTRLLDVGEIGPRNAAADESIASFIPMSGFSETHGDAVKPEPRRWEKIKKGYTHFQNGDIVVAKITPCFENGKAAVIQGLENIIGAGTTELHVVRPIHPDIVPGYIYLFLRSPLFAFEGEKRMTGTAGQKRLPTEYFATCPLPFPPAEEQSRIVKKVDALMALCDKLDAQQQARRKLQNKLRQSILRSFTKPSSRLGLQQPWSRLSNNFKILFSTPEDVEQLRTLILDFAVHGVLVEQSNSDAPIQKWLSHVESTKETLVKRKLIRKQSTIADVDADDYPFELPAGWAFARLGKITNKIGSGSTPRGGSKAYVSEGVPFLRSQNIWNEGLRLESVALIPTEVHEHMSNTSVSSNDLLLNITGASIGRCAMVPAKFGEANVSQHVTIIRPTDSSISNYLHLCMLSPYIQSMVWTRQVGMAREGLSKKVLEQFEIPLPPIAEQNRIVLKAAELMQFCDSLEKQLKSLEQLAKHLSAACIANIIGFSIDNKQEPMKIPKTELIAPLRLGEPPDTKTQAPLAQILARNNNELSAKDLWQRFGGEVDAFYAQLKTEVANGWVQVPKAAEVREKPIAEASV